MGSVGAALAGLRSGGPVLPSGHWHNNEGFLSCEIRPRQTVLKPFDELNGSVVITCIKEISSHGIFIQLDANVDITVEMKVGIDAATTYKEKKGLLKGSETRARGFIRSPIRMYLLKNDHRFQPVVKLPPGKYTYNFRLVVPGDQLPCPFIQKFGELKYKLTVYMKNACCYQMMTEKILEFGGYHNLNLVKDNSEPIVHECGLSASIFSSKQCVKSVFTSDSRCYLPKEEIVFCISIVNPKCYLVKTVTACFAQRTIYSANWRKKITLLELNNFESTEMRNDVEINCVGTLQVPEFCPPTYNVSPLWVYNVIHVIQYEIVIEGRTTNLKGEVEVVIGTTRATEEEMKRKVQRRSSTLPNLLQGGESSSSSPLPLVRRNRSQSIMSRISNISAISTRSLPPTYSELSVRTPSLHSIETLPPHYEEAND